jgi:predicted RNA-binding protein with TRAM domain
MNDVSKPRKRFQIIVGITAVAVIGGVIAAIPQSAVAAPSTQTMTFGYTGSTTTFTVPAGITSLSLTETGAEGGQGGADANGPSPTGGYQGVVTGTMSVTPGQTLTVAVGSGGATGASRLGGNSASAAVGGTNPVASYAGGDGGVDGTSGSSGFGGGGGAATVITTNGTTIVAGGAGGSGGSGQFLPTLGRLAGSTFSGRTDTTSTVGQDGITVASVCGTAGQCDGGSSGAGGGGAQGGAQGQIQFGSGSSDEWYGYGGSPGANSTGNLDGLSAYYSYFADNNAAGSVVISYDTGAPAAPSGVSGTAGDGSANLIWTAPSDTGQGAITDYVVQYALASSPTSWTTFADGTSTDTSATVTALTDGVGYVFQIAAVNSVGTGAYSSPSSTVTPEGPPSTPTSVVANSGDGALSVSFTAPSSGAAVTGYDYQIGSDGWVSSGSSTSPITIPGLVNGTTYAVSIRAESVVGAGAASTPVNGTPEAVSGAPTITALSAGPNSVSVSFTPGFDGGSTVLDYAYQVNGGAWTSADTTSSPLSIPNLAPGTTYTVAILAINGSGSGTPSATSSVTTPSAPGAPTVSSVTAGDGSALISFSPGDTGGSPITGYEYQLTTDGPWADATSLSSPILVPGLTNGTDYSVSVRADNAVGPGAASSPQSVTPATVPGAPAIVGDTVAGSDSQLDAAFSAPTSDGGSAITTYEYSTDGGATWATRSTGSTESPLVIGTLSSDGTTPLVDGQTYQVELRAVNALGAGTASAFATGIAETTPSAPTISTVAAGSGALTVTFAPASNGGAAITNYQYQLESGSSTGSWTDTGTLGERFVIQNLTNGQSYAVRVRAVNVQGDGMASAAVDGTPVDVPQQPTIGSVTRSNQTLTATVAVADDGGSPITAWQYSTDGGTTWSTASGVASPLTITTISSDGTTRLSNGTGYALQVRAVNAVGTSAASATTTVAPSTSPAAPAIALTAGNQSISVAFSTGVDGGSPITAIEYSTDSGITWINAGTLSSPFTITNLTNGTQYAVQVRADNAIGNGTASASAPATPSTIPDAPANVVAVSDSASADVSWDVPVNDGGSVVTGYAATAYSTSTSTTAISSCSTTSATACSITGLTNGTSYYLSVVATNSQGSGAASAPRVVVTPLARPSAPTLSSLTAGDTNLSLAFTAGAAGSDSITGYQYQLNGGAWQNAIGTTSPIMIPSLTDGTSYTVAIRAVSAAGTGTASSTLTATPFTYPNAPDPTSIIGNGGNGQIAVSWAAANMNGGSLDEYIVTAFNAAAGGTQGPQCTSTGLSCTITGLTNGTTYYLSIQTENTLSMLSVRSDPRLVVTPSLQPGAPTAVDGVSGNRQVALSWSAPASTGASAISDYTIWYSASGGAYTQFSDGTSTATSATVTGLTNGTPYTFEVYAVNGNGTSPVSAASAAVIPLAAGVAPVLSTVTSTGSGYTFTISNYDADATYVLSATGGASAAQNGDTVTVTGLTDGAPSTVTVSSNKSGFTDATASVTGSALLTGLTPTFTGITRTSDGFTFAISNYDPDSTYTVTATGDGHVTQDGSTIVVSGLTAGEPSTVTVTASKTGYTDASATPSGAALGAGTAPTFIGLTSTATGFTFGIANYDSSLVYTFGATNGATVTAAGATVTVIGLTNGATSDVTVTATDPGQTTASAAESGAALLTGTAPAVSAVTQTATGFSFTLTLDPADTYSATTTAGTVAIDGSTVTVTALAPGADATVTVTATRAGYTDASTEVDATALMTAIAPLFTDVTRTADGYTFDITNLDPVATYTLTPTNGATVNRAGSTVTVSGLLPDASADVAVTVDRDGYTEAAATQSGDALSTGTTPVLSNVAPTSDGFTFVIANYDASLQYTFADSASGVVVEDGNSVTVSGLLPGIWSTVTVTATDPGVSTASGQTGATSLLAADAPTLSAATPQAGGYTFQILNYSPTVTYSFSESNGGAASQVGAIVTVTGVDAGAYSLTTVTAGVAGYATTTASVGGTAFPDGSVPAVSAITQTRTGFTFTITNYDPANTYTVTSDHGTVVQDGATITVTGLALGASATVHITTAQAGELDETANVVGTAIAAGVAPILSSPVSESGGFVFTITNYSPAFSYLFVATHGAHVTHNGARVTVAGLAQSASSTVVVTASRGGYLDAAASISGAATAPAPVPAPAPTPAPAPAPAPAPVVVTHSTAPTSTPSSPTPQSTLTVAPGTGSVLQDGTAVHSSLTAGKTGVSLTSGGLTMWVAAVSHGKDLPLDASTTVVVHKGGTMHVKVSGFLPGSQVTIWGHSTPVQLDTFAVDSTGTIERTFTLPRSMAVGDHTIIVEGTSVQKEQASMQVGIRIVAAGSSSTANDGWWWWLLLLVLAAIAALLIVARRVRRRRREEGRATA